MVEGDGGGGRDTDEGAYVSIRQHTSAHTAELAHMAKGEGGSGEDTDEGWAVSSSEGEETVSIVRSSLGGGGDRVFFLVPGASNAPQQPVSS